MTRFPKSVLEERRAASLKLIEALDEYEKVNQEGESMLVGRPYSRGLF